MQWSSEALLIGTRRHGETSVIIEVMTEDRGRYLGLVRGGRSRRLKSVLQPGNSLMATWRARLDEHLGAFTVEPLRARAAGLMQSRTRLDLTLLVCDLLRLLAERDPHPRLYAAALALIDGPDDPLALGDTLARFELLVLEELGFGLDLASCAATGGTENLIYVSPRTGRAVSAGAGEVYREKLLTLPDFLNSGAAPDRGQIGQALALTGHFLSANVWSARGIEPPATRDRLVAALL